MQKILFLAIHRPGRSPSQRFRYEQYIPLLEQNGFQCTEAFLLNANGDKIFYSKGKIFGKLGIVCKSIFKLWSITSTANDYDFIFIQREAFMLGTIFFEKRLARSRAKIIYDFDDSIWLLDVSNANKAFAWLKNPDKTSELIKLSDVVVGGNSYLCDYAKQFNTNVKLIPTTIDTRKYQNIGNTNNSVCIGWSGSLTTFKHFKLALPVLKKIKAKYGDRVSIKTMGDPSYKNDELNIISLGWTQDTEVQQLSGFDIGIMPLPDDKWANGKCGLKGLQYMALGIPTIMSPVGVNSVIIQDGINGFLAASEEEWLDKLSQLIESKELRKKLGDAGRKTVEEKYSIESQKDNFLKLFTEL